MQLSHDIVSIHPTHPFKIARGTTTEYRVVWVRVRDGDGAEGWGEADPSRFYGETADTVAAALGVLAPLLERADPWSLETVEAEMARALRFNGAARTAV